MSDLTQLATDASLTTQIIDFHKFVGLAGAPAIEQAVQYFKEQWALPTKLAPIVSLVLGVALNVALAMYLGLSLSEAVGVGAMTGLLASGWHMVNN